MNRLPGSETKCLVVKILAVSSLKSIFCALSVHCIRGNPHGHWRFAKDGGGGYTTSPTVLERELACCGGEGNSLPENKWQEYQQADVRNWI